MGCMARAPATVLENGRVTIPREIREELNLEHGDYVMLDVEVIE